MGLELVAAPAYEPLALAEVKNYLRGVTFATDDQLIGSLILAARTYVEWYLNKRLISQQWRLTLDTFPLYSSLNLPFPFFQQAAINSANPFGTMDWLSPPNYGTLNVPNYEAQTLPNWGLIFLPFPPVTSLDLVQYVDTNSVLQTWDQSNYNFVSSNTPAFIKPISQYPPVKPNTPEVVKITFTCGYATREDVPETIKVAMRMLVAAWYENRRPSELAAPFAQSIHPLLDQHRFWGFV